MKKCATLVLLFFIFFTARSQNLSFKLQENIRLPKDSLELKRILNAFDEFLIGLKVSNENTPHVPDSLKAETYVLLDEIRDCDKNEQQQIENYYSPTVLNIVAFNPQQYLLQFQYASHKDDIFKLRALFELMISVSGDKVYISSPLKFLTRNFKRDNRDGITFLYESKINKNQTVLYRKYCAEFDKKLGLASVQTDVYCFDNILEMQRACGVLFKSDYNGVRGTEWTANGGNKRVVLFANRNAEFTNFDPHDLFHERISIVKARKLLYRPADEGCAYLYGGSWGYNWEQILVEFKKMRKENKDINWIEVKEKPLYFKTGEFRNSADYVVNALIIQKIEKEKGFVAVWRLLNCGPAQAGHEGFYTVLQQLLDIKKENYNAFVEQLITDSK